MNKKCLTLLVIFEIVEIQNIIHMKFIKNSEI